MTQDHGRFERLAVGHVLGGLDEVDAARFRSHLIDCRECRLRVSELRDIASDLAAAEREERVAAAGRVATETEVEQRQDEAEAETSQVDVAPWYRWPWGVVGVAVVVAGLLAVLVWNLSLRQTNEQLLSVTDQRETVLRVLAEGELAEVTAETGTTGLVAADGTTVALDLAGVQAPRPGQVLVVWQLDGQQQPLERSSPILAGQIPEGRLALAQQRAVGARSVVVTVEGAPVTVDAPTGLRVVTAELAP